jgi:lipoate---protein ligase
MKIIDDISASPEENLAMDELLLLKAEKGELGETLRFWMPEEYFVVMGRSGKAEEECEVSACAEDGVKILRRISGGGTVLQGKGWLNYSAVLSYLSDESYRGIGSSYSRIMENLVGGFRKKHLDAEFMPVSDLAVGGRKFSGNAQARKRAYFLHHGTILFDMDISMIGRYLKHPAEEPEYRAKREHGDFVRNIPLSPEDVKEIICDALSPDAEKSDINWGIEGLDGLVEDKYSKDSWNLYF